jgi:predicted permease
MTLYRLLLRAYPEPFRALYGADLEADFQALRERVRAREGRRGVAKLWARTVVDVLRTAARERRSTRGYRVGSSRLRVPRRGFASFVADLQSDVRMAARSTLRAPGYAAAVVATLGLGIGANTALFSVAYGTLLRPLPFAEGEQLIRLVQEAPPGLDPTGPPSPISFSVADLQSYDSGVAGLVETSEYHSMTFTLIDGQGPHRVRAGVVSANYFDFLGLEALHGRVLRPAEDHLDADPVIVLTHRYWTERFDGDPGVVGRRVRMNDRVHEIVGVLPPGPQFPFERDIFLPISACPTRSDPQFIADPTGRMMFAYARVAEDVDHETVARQARAVLEEQGRIDPESWPVEAGMSVRVVPLRDDMAAEVRPLAVGLLTIAGLVLLIACANAAGLALARAGRRIRELEVRGALGAGRGRLVRTLLTEAVILAIVGGALGLTVAIAGHDLLVDFAGRFTTRAQEIRLDAAVLGFAAATSIVTGLVFGAVPGMWIGGRTRPAALESLAVTLGPRGRGWQRALVVGQVAVAFAVVSMAGLALRTVWAVGSTELGYPTASVAVMQVAVDKARWRSPDSARVLFDRITSEVRAVPGVSGASRAMGGPLTGHGHGDAYYVGSRDQPALAGARVVDPGFFELLGLTVLEGRSFGKRDGADAEPVVVVNRTFRDRHLAEGNPLGVVLTRCHGPDECLPPARVVGVVEDVRYDGPDAAVGPAVYSVARQQPDFGGEHVVVGLRDETAELEAALIEAVHRVDPELAVSGIATLDGLRRERTHPRRFLAALLAAMAAVAAGLAVAGIFGVASLAAAARSHELGIRRMLGASPRGVALRIVGEGIGVTSVGLALGAALATGAAWIFSRFLESVLWGVAPNDLPTFAATTFLFLTVAVAAAWAPARRAASEDPLQILKRP